MSGYIILILSIFAAILLVRLKMINSQLKSIRRQLKARKSNHTHELLSLELVSGQLNDLAALVNELLCETERVTMLAERREKAFKEMIESISHDLRTPLTAIKGNLQLLEQKGLGDRQKGWLAMIQKHAGNMEILIEKFWEYSFYSAGDQQMVLKKVNLTNLAAQCIADQMTQFENKGRVVVFEQEVPIFAWSDVEYCTRIVGNLLQNCMHHGAGDVKVQLFENSAFAILSVQNPVEEQPPIDTDKLFDRFYTADKVRSKASGLGLAVVRLLSEKMGGRCSAKITQGILDIRVELPTGSRKYN